MKEKKEEGAKTTKSPAEPHKHLIHLLRDRRELLRFRHLSAINAQQLLDGLERKFAC